MKAKKIAKKKIAKKVKKYDFDKPEVKIAIHYSLREAIDRSLAALSLIDKSKKIVVTYKLSLEGRYTTSWDMTY